MADCESRLVSTGRSDSSAALVEVSGGGGGGNGSDVRKGLFSLNATLLVSACCGGGGLATGGGRRGKAGGGADGAWPAGPGGGGAAAAGAGAGAGGRGGAAPLLAVFAPCPNDVTEALWPTRTLCYENEQTLKKIFTNNVDDIPVPSNPSPKCLHAIVGDCFRKKS